MIFINDIPSLRNPENTSHTFDDRVDKIELINGNVAQDYGHIESGDTDAITCVFSAKNFERIKTLWASRTRIAYTDENGTVHNNLRLVFRNIRRVNKFPDYVILSFELWRI